MESSLKSFIHVYENVLNESVCRELIDLFESNPSNHERFDNYRTPNFTQFNLTKNHKLTERVEKLHSFLVRKTLEYKKIYYKDFDVRCFPQNNSFEEFRIKKYNNDGHDAFDYHVDVVDGNSSRRFLSFFWYLNDVSEGGETTFGDFSIKPKTGKLVIFPPLWMFPHQGNPPLSNTKYLLSTYLHYI